MTTTPVPLRVIKPGEIYHPPWCSPDHCRVNEIGKTHESAPVEVAGLTLTVAQPAMDRPTDAVVMIDSCPDDQEIKAVVLRFGDVPAFASTLLGLYSRQ